MDISDNLSFVDEEVFKTLKVVGRALEKKQIDDDNYRDYIRVLADAYFKVGEYSAQLAERSIRDHKKYLVLNKMARRYTEAGLRITDLLEHEFPHVFEFKEKNGTTQKSNQVVIKPIFISDRFDQLVNADHNLIMSATISEKFILRTMNLQPADKVKYIRLEPQFPKKNKKVQFFKPQTLNFTTLKDPDTIKKLAASVYQIVDFHTKEEERGIILAPSFNLCESMAASLREMRIPNLSIYEHVRGEKLADWIRSFKRHKGGPAVFLTPSGFEGLDLPGDLSRYQILLKAPFGALGDKRIKVIAEAYPDIYALTTLMKVVQGAGRSVRGPDDYATTYILDQAGQRLWTDKANEWLPEFTSSFSSVLEPTQPE